MYMREALVCVQTSIPDDCVLYHDRICSFFFCVDNIYILFFSYFIGKSRCFFGKLMGHIFKFTSFNIAVSTHPF